MRHLTLTQQLSDLKGKFPAERPEATNRFLGRSVVELIRLEPVYGLLLAKINREADDHLAGPLGLGWSHRQLVLLYDPRLVSELNRGNEILALLVHVALHVIWLHPVVYSRPNWLVKLATDAEVNQYVPFLPRDAVTLDGLNWRFKLHLPERAGSRFYLERLRRFFKKRPSVASRLRTIMQKRSRRGDSHRGWRSAGDLSHEEKADLIKHLVRRSWRQANAKGRGKLPGQVLTRLLKLTPHRYVSWQRYVRLGLGRTPFARQPSRARFNRRQAYRMDLMGSVSSTVQTVDIFVDNSGSMSDLEISYLLAQIGSFLRKFPVQITVYSFDTRIHKQDVYQANNYHQLHFKRYGGGGTCFQSIFDFCGRCLTRFTDSLIMILTDGQGERRLNYRGMYHLLWLLTVPSAKFSVENVRGHVVSLVNDPGFKEQFIHR